LSLNIMFICTLHETDEKCLTNPVPKTHTNFIFRDKVMMYILCV
jgi:hypothetical protein